MLSVRSHLPLRLLPARLGAGLVLAVALVAGGVGAQENTISVGIGFQKVLNVPPGSKVQIANPDIAAVGQAGSNAITITGVREGRTGLLVFHGSRRTEYTIVVRSQDPGEIANEVRRLLSDVEGVNVRQQGDHVYIEGQVYTGDDADRIDKIVQQYPMVKSLVRLAPGIKDMAARNITQALQKAGLRNVQATAVGSTIFLEGSVESPVDLKKVELISQGASGGQKIESLVTVGLKKMIMSEVQFVEIRRTGRDRYGIEWPTDITGTGIGIVTGTRELYPGVTFTANSQLSVIGTAGFAIGLQSGDGYGRLLAQPTLVCASGEKAEFLAGGELPIPLITQNQFTVEYKKYGIVLNIRPTADRTGNIQTEIEAEVSQVDTSVAVSIGPNASIPGFLVRRVKTNVTVRHGETIILSGVFSHDEQKNVLKVPGLGHIPILGELFKDRAFDNSKRELVIFVTPRIVTPDSDQIRQGLEDIKSRYKQAWNEVNFSLFD